MAIIGYYVLAIGRGAGTTGAAAPLPFANGNIKYEGSKGEVPLSKMLPPPTALDCFRRLCNFPFRKRSLPT